MPDTTKIGEGMIDYILTLDFIIKGQMEALEKAEEQWGKLPDLYEGDALEEMDTFMQILVAQITKLIFFYTKMQEYIGLTYQSLHLDDSVMTAHMVSRGVIQME